MRSPIQLMTTRCLLSVVITANILMIVKSSSSPSFKQVEYTNEFAIHVDASSRQEADSIANQIAQENGFINRGQVSHYLYYCFEQILLSLPPTQPHTVQVVFNTFA